MPAAGQVSAQQLGEEEAAAAVLPRDVDGRVPPLIVMSFDPSRR